MANNEIVVTLDPEQIKHLKEACVDAMDKLRAAFDELAEQARLFSDAFRAGYTEEALSYLEAMEKLLDEKDKGSLG